MLKVLRHMGKIVFAAAFVTLFAGCNYLQGNQTPPDTQQKDSQIESLQSQVKVMQDQQSQTTQQTQPATEQTIQSQAADTATKALTDSKKTAYTGPSYIVLKTPNDEQTFYEEPINFSGTVSPDAIKIVVKQSTTQVTDGPIPNSDVYTLQNFKPGAATFSYQAKNSFNNLYAGTNEFQFTATFVDGSQKSDKVKIYFTPGGAEMGKPVIYIYPKAKTDVYVNVKPNNGISVSDPAIGNGWNVTADPTGKIVNKADNKVYPYLFWEGFAANFVTPKEGFVVGRADVSRFFAEKLAYQGLNQKEIADFLEYWAPKLNEKPYYFVTFIDQKTFNNYAPLTVRPTPDTLIRVFFDYKGLDQKVTVPAQVLKQGVRSGFTVIEWGGRLYR